MGPGPSISSLASSDSGPGPGRGRGIQVFSTSKKWQHAKTSRPVWEVTLADTSDHLHCLCPSDLTAALNTGKIALCGARARFRCGRVRLPARPTCICFISNLQKLIYCHTFHKPRAAITPAQIHQTSDACCMAPTCHLPGRLRGPGDHAQLAGSPALLARSPRGPSKTANMPFPFWCYRS